MPENAKQGAAAVSPQAAVLFLWAETPVHAGAGGGKTALDLPIQRSVQTEWPILNDATVRGGLRRLITDEALADKLFGTEAGDEAHPGCFSTPDAELLLFPIASAAGLTAWVTCVPALRYFLRRLEMFKPLLSAQAQGKVQELEGYLDAAGTGPESEKAWVAKPCELLLRKAVVLESDCFGIPEDKSADDLAKWFSENAMPLSQYWVGRLKSHFVLIPEEAFTHYVKTKTDIRTRVRIEQGRAAKSGPWTEENLPVDTLLYTTLSETHTGKKGESRLAETHPARLQTFLDEVKIAHKPVLQLGGDQNLGRGMLRMRELGG